MGFAEEKEALGKMEHVQKFIKEHKPDLTIYRVPEPTLVAFKEFAAKEFANDYGMALKWLLDNASTFAVMFGIINEIDMRLSKLEGKEPQPRQIRMLSNRVITLPQKR